MNNPSTYNIAISGTFDVENYGDLMFPIVAEHELRRRLGNVCLTRYSYLEKAASSWPYEVTPLRELNRNLPTHKALLIGGGHLIRFDKDVAQSYYPSDGNTHHPTGYWLTPAFAAANAGVPIFWNGPSASLDTPAWAAPLLRAGLNMSDYVAVRDEPTASELRRVGYSGPCSIIPDTVFGLPDLLPLEDARARAAPLLEQAGITGPYIVVQAKSELADIAKAITAHPDTRGLQILVVSIGPILGERASLITDVVPEAKMLNYWPEPLDIAALIAASAGTVAISLHLTITSLCYGLPVLRYSRTRLTKYEFIEASRNVFLHAGGEQPLPANYISHLTIRKPCTIAQQAKSVLDAHWDHITRMLDGKGTSGSKPVSKNFFGVWNSVMAQAEKAAENAMQTISESRTEIALRKEQAASRDVELLAVTQERDQNRKSYDVLIAKQALLESQISNSKERHIAENSVLAKELDALKRTFAELLEMSDSTRLTLEEKERELLDARFKIDQMQQFLVDRDTRIQSMIASRSWRLTSPLRGGTTLARRFKNKVLRGAKPSLPAPSDAIAANSQQLDAPILSESGSSLPGSGAMPKGEPFDEEFYVSNYPDVADSGMDPYQHYIEFGKAEQRLGVPPPLLLSENAAALHEGLDYVLVVCHEATRTGAPILGWNICRELGKRYNVVALLLGDGDIAQHFVNDCAVVAGPFGKSVRTPTAIGRTIAELNQRFKLSFAIVNSIASRSVLRPLAEQYVPSVLLVHEFSKFHCYPDEIVDTLGWAGEVVFPAKVVQENSCLERTQPSIRHSHIIPQGQSAIPTNEAEDSIAARGKAELECRDLIRQVLPQGDGPDRPFIVLGAGTIEYRKGVDLFIAAATKIKRMAPERKILMVWVGRTYDTPEHQQYRRFLEDQILKADLRDSLIMLEETPHLDQLYALADVFFVSARLDPLPNVAIDAMTLGTPVICFENATGVAEILSSNEALAECVLPYLNAQAAAQAILDISASTSRQLQISEASKLVAAQKFGLPDYVKKLETLAISATAATYQRRADEVALLNSAEFTPGFYRARRSQDSDDHAARTYLKQSQSRIYIRKPAPGFDPAAYASHMNLTTCDPDPYLHWLQAGRPQGVWQQPILDIANADVVPATKARVGVHVHAYYPDLLPSILDRMELNELECDYLISVPNALAGEEVSKLLDSRSYKSRCLIRQTTNRGRDIGPFFTGFAEELARYDIVAHFHTKKSPHVTLSNLVPDWIEFLLENMIGGKFRAADAILTAFSKDGSLGLVLADDPHLIGWDKNRHFAELLAEKMGMPPLEDGFIPFPVGTMFWARPQALAPIFDMKLDWGDYPAEPLPIDGSMLHALERLLPATATHAGYTHLSTYAAGINR